MNEDYHFWGITYDAWFTGVTPVILFFLGYLLNKYCEEKKEKDRIDEFREYIMNELKLLDEPISQQIAFIKSNADKLNTNRLEHLILETNLNFSIRNLKEVKFEELYKIFKTKTNINFHKIQLYKECINGLNSNFELNIENSLKLIKRFELFQSDYNKAMENLEEELMNIVAKFKTNQNKVKYLQAIDKIRFNWMNYDLDDRSYKDMFVSDEYYIEPLRVFCRANSDVDEFFLLLPKILKVRYAVIDLKETREVIKNQFIETANRIDLIRLKIKNKLID